MYGRSSRDRWSATFDGIDGETPDLGEPLQLTAIFRQLISDEIRSGQLTPARRRRIVQYAANLGLTAVEAGHLIAICREEILRDGRHAADTVDPPQRRHALRLVEADPPRVPSRVKVALVIAAILIADFMLMRWLL